jgi:Na+-translocating ferredoxin:NAD+ oxidoreductase subunit B
MPKFLAFLLHPSGTQQKNLAENVVVAESGRCVQCGICSYNCPVGIDIRWHSSQNIPIHDSRCLTCGECVLRCPRGALHFEQAPLVKSEKDT